MALSRRILTLLAGGSAVGVGAAGAAVTTQEATTPGPVELGAGGTSLDIEGGQVRVDAQASPLDDLLDSANTAGSPDTPGTEDVNTAGTESADTNTPNSANTNSPDTANTASADTGTGDSPSTPDSPDTADSADSPDNSGPGSLSSGPGPGGDEGDDNSGPSDNSGSGSGDGDDDNSGPGS
ncbi:MAG TPA: hypothetical protein VE737_10760 [Actinomycetota bacterium]|jgi:hypothetical protein|nr:hypothetical protein [Actinomycetota bacterium]